MKVRYNNTEYDVAITNIDVLEAIDSITADIEALKVSKSMADTISCMKCVEDKVKSITTASGIEFNELFPKRDYIDYMKFIQAVVNGFNTADFKNEIK